MDRELTLEERRQKAMRTGLVAVGVVATIAVILWTLVGWARPAVSRSAIRTDRVERGDLEATLSASGVVVPAFEAVISSAIDARVLKVLRQPGVRVQKGEPLVSLDIEQAKLTVAKLDQQLTQKMNDELRLHSQIEGDVVTLQSQIEQKKLDVDILKYRHTQNRKLHAEGLVSEEVLRQSDVAERKAAIELQQLNAALVRAQRSGDVQVRTATIDRSIVQRDREEASRQLQLATATADRDGVLTWITPMEGATVRQGEVIARIADLSSMRIEGSASDVHASALRVGLNAHVRADERRYRGRIVSVAPAVTNGVVKFFVELDAGQGVVLHSQQRVDVDVVTAQKRGVLKVAKGAFDAGSTSRIFVIDGPRALRRQVKLGISGSDEYEVISGLEAGEEVIVSDMKRFADLKEVRVK